MSLKKRSLSAFVALGAGWLQSQSIASFPAGNPQWWLQLVSLAMLVLLLEREAQRELSWSSSTWVDADRPSAAARGFWLGWLFGVAWLSGTFWWLFISMHTYGGLAAPLAVLAVLALSAFLALYYGAACGVFLLLFNPQVGANRFWRAVVFAAVWTLAELVRGTWFTGFPWGAGGYAHVSGPFAGYAPWLGVYGLGMLAALLAASLALLLPRAQGRSLQAGWLAAGVALVVLTGAPWALRKVEHSRAAGTLGVTLLQGNIEQGEKFQPSSGIPAALQWYGEQFRDARTPLVVGPETAVPVLPQQLPDGYWDGLKTRFATGNQAALLGVPLGDITLGYTNAAVGFKPGAADLYRYDKHHLVPFGEFIPPLFKWFTSMMNIPLGDFNRGDLNPPSFEWQGQRLAPNICYEDLFGEELGTRFADAALAPTVMVNLSNIAWFGDSVAIDQHLSISRMRALEFERPMLRATNTGATAIIDHRGRVVQALPRLTRGVLVGDVEGRTGTTPFAWWVSRLGLWPLWGLALLVVGVAAVLRRKN